MPIIILFIGCSKLEITNNEIASNNDIERLVKTKSVKSELTRQEANFAALKYLSLVDNRYKLNLSEIEALNLGISKIDYAKMVLNVKEVNDKISSLSLDPNCKLDLPDPQDVKLEYNAIRLKTNIESGGGGTPVGSGSLNGQYPAIFNVTVPSGYRIIHVDIYSSALIGYGTAELSNSNGLVSSDYTVRFSFFGGGGCDLDVPQSGVTYTLTIRVASSDGGSYSYYYK